MVFLFFRKILYLLFSIRSCLVPVILFSARYQTYGAEEQHSTHPDPSLEYSVVANTASGALVKARVDTSKYVRTKPAIEAIAELGVKKHAFVEEQIFDARDFGKEMEEVQHSSLNEAHPHNNVTDRFFDHFPSKEGGADEVAELENISALGRCVTTGKALRAAIQRSGTYRICTSKPIILTRQISSRARNVKLLCGSPKCTIKAGRGNRLFWIRGTGWSFNGITFQNGGFNGRIEKGGALYFTSSIVQAAFYNCQFVNNRATMSGGAVYSIHTGKINFKNCIDAGDYAPQCQFARVGNACRQPKFVSGAEDAE